LEAINRYFMKPTMITRRIFSIGMALAVATVAFSAAAAPQSARVINMHGLARYSTGNNVWVPVSVGTVLKPGAMVQTASESSVDVLLSGEAAAKPSPIINQNSDIYRPSTEALQTVVRLRDNTLLAIDKLTAEQTGVDTVSDTQLDLRAGRAFVNVKKTSAASRFEIKLPNGVAGIRGSVGEFAAGGFITMYSGSTVVTYMNPSNPTETITKVINAGQQYDLNTDTYKPVPMGAREQALNDAGGMSTPPAGGQPGVQVAKDPTISCISPTSPSITSAAPVPPEQPEY
jgi:hypothetical protein